MLKWILSPIISSVFVIGILYAIKLNEDYYIKHNISESASVKEWQRPFNGYNFEGWELLLRNGRSDELSKVYTIDKDGTLHFFRDMPLGGNCAGAKENQKCATHGIMVTDRKYSRFHLKFEYKWGKKLFNDFEDWQYDSGVFVHIQKKDIWPNGIQYQIRYDHLSNKNYSGELRSSSGFQWYSSDGKAFDLPSNGGILHKFRSGWKVLQVSEDAPFHGLDNQWNQCEIIAMGKEYVIFKLNGQIVNMAVNLDVKAGPIAFEAETGEIFWRNIEIKEFERTVPMIEFMERS